MSMAYSRAQDFSDDWESRGPLSSSRSYSTSSRSMGQPSRSQSTASSSSRGRSSNAAQYEAAAQTYHAELEKFLANMLAKEAAEGPSPQRVSARQKLARLNNLQFHELAMDVYDELMRRNMNDKQVPFLPVREEFHPRRNQARQKLATLPTPRFQDLASDVYHELSRRYPPSEDSYRPPVPPIPASAKSTETTKPQASQATNIVPVKGTINVEAVELPDDERAYMPNGGRSNMDDRSTFLSDHSGSNPTGYRGVQPKASPSTSSKPMKNGHLSNTSAGSESNFQSLDSLMADLGNMVTGKGSSPTDLDDRERKLRLDREATERMRADYEERIAGLTKRCQQLEADLAMARERKGSMSSDMDADAVQLRKKDQERQNRLKQLQDEYNRLDDRYRQLELEHRNQKDAVDEVKEETTQLLEQIKILSSKNDDLRIEKERAEAQVKQLSEEVKEWQEKYEKSRLELRTLKAMSMDGSDIPIQKIDDQEFLKPTASGVISHDHILAYQVAINDLLKTARSSKPSQVLPVMQTIILTCKAITEQVETHEARGEIPSSTQNNLYNLKTQVSTALMNLLSAVKTHAAGMGISPVCLVDASAANMTKVIVDLAKLLGISPGQADGPIEINSVKNGTAPKNALKRVDVLDPEELSGYLKSETDNIVQSIQNLLAALRSPSQSSQVYGIITNIINIVSTLMQVSEKTLSSTAGFRFRKRGNLVISDLDRCKQKVTRIRDSSFDRSPETASANAKRDLAKEAYEIAKYTKELINIFES